MRTAGRARAKPRIVVRPGTASDLAALNDLERRAFATDRISARSFRHALASPTATLIVAEHDSTFAGYAAVLFRRGAFVARLYSIAVEPKASGRGIGRALLEAAEREAFVRDCLFMRLEVHAKNRRAAAFYERAGYVRLDDIAGYYQDGATALRFEKWLAPPASRLMKPPPYFHQTTDFTCGPACMVMAMAWAKRPMQPGAALEYRLWREATTIFMASGLGGCEPFGLGVTLKRHGLEPEIHVSNPGPYFSEQVQSRDKRRVMRVAQAEFRREAEQLGIPVTVAPLPEAALRAEVHAGACAIVLVTGYHLSRGREPHWVFVYGHAERCILLHDPEAERDAAGRPKPSEGWAVPSALFARMSRAGTDELRATIVIRKGPPQ